MRPGHLPTVGAEREAERRERSPVGGTGERGDNLLVTEVRDVRRAVPEMPHGAEGAARRVFFGEASGAWLTAAAIVTHQIRHPSISSRSSRQA